MCGIAGIFAPEGFDPQRLVEMTHLIRYRGPDAYGFLFAGPDSDCGVEIIHGKDDVPKFSRPVLGLGNRRLAILDLSPAGNQPMSLEDEKYSITFNGEIYNYKEIREELQQAGHVLHSGTDTEVILHAYQQWGEECLQRFNGMWSFALWDRPRGTLFCARDRLGVKPFYWAVHARCFYFGSEIKQLLTASGMPRTANPSAVYHFLEWGLQDYSAETMFQGIYQLPGSHSLTLHLAEPLRPEIRRYWNPRTDTEEPANLKSAVDEFRGLFAAAVNLRLRSDVPVGVCLSGGLDSSAVLCQAARIAPDYGFHTFSACFEDPSLDERDYISAVLSFIGASGKQVFPDGQSFWQQAQEIAFHLDEPIGNSSAFAQWSVMKAARSAGVPVVLGGQGGDEILCGYSKYQYFHLWHLLQRLSPAFLRESWYWAKNGTRSYRSIASVARYLPGPLRRRWSLTERLATREVRHEYSTLRTVLGATRTIAERQKIDLTYSSLPALLHHEDRNSMAHSVESRLPFLDYRLVEFALRCPAALKLRNGWSKWILREALTGTLPETVRLRKTKLGFNTPEAHWMRIGLRNGHRKLLNSPRLRMERFLNSESLAHECREFLRGSPLALPAASIFRAVSLELWADVFQVT